MEIKKQQFKSFSGINELIITHGPHIRTVDVAQHILDMQNELVMLKDIIQDLKTKEKKLEKMATPPLNVWAENSLSRDDEV